MGNKKKKIYQKYYDFHINIRKKNILINKMNVQYIMKYTKIK